MLLNSILAGFLIGIGDIALMQCDNRYIGAFLFSVALMSIIYFGLPLFTGRVGRMIQDGTYITCLCILVYNMIGVLLAVGSYMIMTPDGRQHVMDIADQKFGRGYLVLFLAGIMCNVLIHIAVRAKQPIITILCVMTFILCGFEHSVADAGFLLTPKRVLLPWVMVVIGNTVGALLTFYFLHESEGEIEDGKD